MAWFVPVTSNLARVEAVFELLETWSPPPLLSCGGAQEERRRWKRPAPDMQSLGIQVTTKDTKTYLFIPRKPTRKPLLLGYFQQNCRKIYIAGQLVLGVLIQHTMFRFFGFKAFGSGHKEVPTAVANVSQQCIFQWFLFPFPHILQLNPFPP